MRLPRLAVVRPFPPCFVSAGHYWSRPTIDGVQECGECGIWRLVDVPIAGTLPGDVLDVASNQHELIDMRIEAAQGRRA